jgi:hypothetical protein
MRISGFGAEQQIQECASGGARNPATGECDYFRYGSELTGGNKLETSKAGPVFVGVLVGVVAIALAVRGAMGAYIGKKANIKHAGIAGAIGGTTGLAAATLLD